MLLTRPTRRRGLSALQAVILLGAGFVVAWGLMEVWTSLSVPARETAEFTIKGGMRQPNGAPSNAAALPPLTTGPEATGTDPGDEPAEATTPTTEEPKGRSWFEVGGDVVTVVFGTAETVAFGAAAIATAPTVVGTAVLGTAALSSADDTQAALRRLLGDESAESFKYQAVKKVTGNEAAARIFDGAAGIVLGGRPSVRGVAKAGEETAQVVGAAGRATGGAAREVGAGGRAVVAVENAGEGVARGTGAVLTGTRARKLLAESLGANPYKVQAEAHHIFGVELFSTPLGQRLHNWGVNLNGAENGVWLPKYDFPGRVNSAGIGPSLHRGRSAGAYIDEVMERLGDARSKDTAIEILSEIRQDLLTGRLKINNAQ